MAITYYDEVGNILELLITIRIPRKCVKVDRTICWIYSNAISQVCGRYRFSLQITYTHRIKYLYSL